MTITSSAFAQDGSIPKKHTCDGEDVSPELGWAGLPAGVKSLAVIMDDPDATAGSWVHWVLFDIPPVPARLGENIARKKDLPDGSMHGRCWGPDGGAYTRTGYYGPCPPPGKTHRYVFKVYALDRMLALPPECTKEELLAAMRGHILSQGQLTGLYKRP